MASPHRWIGLAVPVVAFIQTRLHRMAFVPLIPGFVSDRSLSHATFGATRSVTVRIAE